MGAVIPGANQRGLLQFRLAKNLPYARRMTLAGALILAGFALEILLPPPFALLGLAPLAAAAMLLATAGYTNRPALPEQGGLWKTAPLDRLETLAALHRKTVSWDRAFLDISNPLGFFAFVAFLALTGFVALIVSADSSSGFGFLLTTLSGLTLAAPIWFTGLRAGFTHSELALKVKTLQQTLKILPPALGPGEEARLSLRLLGPEKEEVPDDVKLQIAWRDADAGFYGLQFQVNINTVQGNRYPYAYFVVVARRGMNIFQHARGLTKGKNITIETRVQNDVEVIIIRQTATRTSGYYTKPPAIAQLAAVALEAARRAARANPAPG